MAKIKILLALFIISFFNLLNLNAQNKDSYLLNYEPRAIIDMPTAGLIPKGQYSINSSIYTGGGVAANFTVGVFTNFNFGISWTANSLIGNENITSQEIPGVNLSYRFLDEILDFPAILIGINTQGKSIYFVKEERFETYSSGVYLVASKNFKSFLGSNSIHWGINYSLEPSPNKRKVNTYLGFEQLLGNNVSFSAEYNFLLNESDNIVYKSGRGMLSSSLKFSPTDNFVFELQFRDLLKARKLENGISRIIAFDFINRL